MQTILQISKTESSRTKHNVWFPSRRESTIPAWRKIAMCFETLGWAIPTVELISEMFRSPFARSIIILMRASSANARNRPTAFASISGVMEVFICYFIYSNIRILFKLFDSTVRHLPGYEKITG